MLALVTGDMLEMLAILQGMNQRGRAQCVLPQLGELRDIPINGRDCVLLITGSGMQNAMQALTALFARYQKLEGILSFGLAGTFSGLPVGSIGRTHTALCDSACYPHCKATLPAEQAPTLQIAYGPEHLGLDPLPSDCHTLRTLTIENTENTQLLQIGARHEADIESTEAYALAFLCNQYSVPLLDMRIVCGEAGQRAAQYNVFAREFARLGTLARQLFLTPARW